MDGWMLSLWGSHFSGLSAAPATVLAVTHSMPIQRPLAYEQGVGPAMKLGNGVGVLAHSLPLDF